MAKKMTQLAETQAHDDDPTRSVMALPPQGGTLNLLAYHHCEGVVRDAIGRCGGPDAVYRHLVATALGELLCINESGRALLRDQDMPKIEQALKADSPVDCLLSLICKAIIRGLVATARVDDVPKQIGLATKVRRSRNGPRKKKEKKDKRLDVVKRYLDQGFVDPVQVFDALKRDHPDLVKGKSLKTIQNNMSELRNRRP